jgi:hypothetical protein
MYIIRFQLETQAKNNFKRLGSPMKKESLSLTQKKKKKPKMDGFADWTRLIDGWMDWPADL